ncbi:MAG: MerR family transcriptional regulator [Pseudomonadota bacterium]
MARKVVLRPTEKSAEAFKTIAEVADELDVQKHVLRFWEVKFTVLKPMKRGGGRRYYRHSDLQLLYGIRQLLHGDGFTIRGVQKLIREQGVESVKSLGRSLMPGAAATDEADTRVATPGAGADIAADAAGQRVRSPLSASSAADQSTPARGPQTASGSSDLAVEVAALAQGRANAKQAVTPHATGMPMLDDALDVAVSELDICRRILTGELPASAVRTGATARARR